MGYLLKQRTIASTQGYDYVDLGLPSGLLWARCNIGADEPTDYGDYFMWGSVEPDTDKHCDWEHAPFNNGNNDFNKEYFKSIQNQVCPNGILTPEYDAATSILGDEWRLPTEDDFKELIDNTEHEWVENYKDSNANGMLFTSKTDADNTMFIPTSGALDKHTIKYKENYIFLWAATINTTITKFAYTFIVHSTGLNILSNKRYYGFCLRGVKK